MDYEYFNIVRRAYGQYEVVAMVRGTWADAANFAMEARVINNYDGEYFERSIYEPEMVITSNNQCEVQRAFAYL